MLTSCGGAYPYELGYYQMPGLTKIMLSACVIKIQVTQLPDVNFTGCTSTYMYMYLVPEVGTWLEFYQVRAGVKGKRNVVLVR